MATEFERFHKGLSQHISSLKNKKDYVKMSKVVNKSLVVLVGGKDRGAVIHIYLKGKEEIDTIADEIHFMFFQNALDEYKHLNSNKALLDIIRRNS